MPKNTHILVVDDDPSVRAIMAACLKKAGYRVSEAEDAAGLRAWMDHGGVDLVLLDVNLPDGDGMTLARQVRAVAEVGIIMVTERGAPDDRALGLEIGADDYLPKPVYPRELLARIKNVLDRRQPLTGSGLGGGQPRLCFGVWSLDPQERRVCDTLGRSLDLTPAEFDLLAVLVARAGRIQSREQLIEAVGSTDADAGLRSVDILISRLRKKLDHPDHPNLIETCRGHGYRFTAKVKRATS